MDCIEPSFEIDKKGRVLCKKHTNYPYFIDPKKDFFEEMFLDSELTCKKCSHYRKDECYFSKTRIDEIEQKRLQKKRHYKCKLCGKNLDRMFTIVYKFYNKEKYNIEIPLVCCECYYSISQGYFLKDSFGRIIISIFYFTFLLFSLSIFLFLKDIYAFMEIFFFLWLVPWIIIAFICLKKICIGIIGIYYYKKYFVKSEFEIKRE